MNRRPLMIQDHREAIRYFNSLIVDLMKREMGLEHEPVTMERLEEASKHIKDIRQCQRPAIVRYAQVGEWLRGGGRAEYEVEDLPFADDIVKAFEDFEDDEAQAD